MRRNIGKWFTLVVILLLSTMSVAVTISGSSELLDTKKADFNNMVGSRQFLDEGFEDGVMPPEGWTVIINEPDYTWQITDYPVYHGDYAAYCPVASLPVIQDEWLITPEIDMTGAYNIDLSFWANSLSYAADWTVYVKIRIVGEEDWVILWDLVAEEEWYDGLWHNKVLDLTDYHREVFQIAWQSVGENSRDFYLDHVQLYVSGTPPAELEIRNITGGYEGSIKGGIVSAEILNIEPWALPTEIECKITVIGGLFNRINVTSNIIIELEDKEIVQTEKPIRGFGKVNITINANSLYDPRVEPVEKSVDGFVFLFFVIILPES